MSVRGEAKVGLGQEVGDKREERSSSLLPGLSHQGRTWEEGAGLLLRRVWEPWAAAGIPLSCLSRESWKTVPASKLQMKEQNCKYLWTYALESLIDILNPSGCSLFLLSLRFPCILFLDSSIFPLHIRNENWSGKMGPLPQSLSASSLNGWYLSLFFVPCLVLQKWGKSPFSLFMNVKSQTKHSKSMS